MCCELDALPGACQATGMGSIPQTRLTPQEISGTNLVFVPLRHPIGWQSQALPTHRPTFSHVRIENFQALEPEAFPTHGERALLFKRVDPARYMPGRE